MRKRKTVSNAEFARANNAIAEQLDAIRALPAVEITPPIIKPVCRVGEPIFTAATKVTVAPKPRTDRWA